MDKLDRNDIFRFICKNSKFYFEILKQHINTINSSRIYGDDCDNIDKTIEYVGISHFIKKKDNDISLNTSFAESGWLFPYDQNSIYVHNKNNFYYGYECKLRKSIVSRGLQFNNDNIRYINENIKQKSNNIVIFTKEEITLIFHIDELLKLFYEVLDEILDEIKNNNIKKKREIMKENIMINIKMYSIICIILIPYMLIIKNYINAIYFNN